MLIYSLSELLKHVSQVGCYRSARAPEWRRRLLVSGFCGGNHHASRLLHQEPGVLSGQRTHSFIHLSSVRLPSASLIYLSASLTVCPGRPAGVQGFPGRKASSPCISFWWPQRRCVYDHLQLVPGGFCGESAQWHPVAAVGCLPVRGHQGTSYERTTKSWQIEGTKIRKQDLH